MRDLAKERLASRPGATWQYSNTNYQVLGLVVQTLSGQPYAVYMREHVFSPLGLYNTSAGPASQLAQGHRTWFGVPVPADAPYVTAMAPAGMVSSTARDLAQYVSAQLGDVPMPELDAPGVDQLHRPGPNAGGYAMGWFVGRFGGAPAVHHGGDIFTYSSDLALLPQRHTGVVVVTNQAFLPGEPATRIADGVVRILNGKTPAPAGVRATTIVLILDVILAALLALALVRAIGLRWWRQPAHLPAVFAYDIVLPMGLLLFLTRAAPLPVAWWGLPDATACVVGASAVLLVCGVVHVAVRVTRRADHAAVGDAG